jgi:thymidylate synthase
MRKILELLIKNGAKLAEPGEFTKRAFLNGRIDLIQAEAIIDIITSKTDRARSVSVTQLQGYLSEKIDKIQSKIYDVLIQIEAGIDYPEHEIEDVTRETIFDILENSKKEIKKLCDSFDEGRVLKDGVRTAILGKPNVGKSSLMNTLLRDIQEDPYGRRHIMSLWQEDDLRGEIGLPPCAFQTMWTVRGEFLDCTLIQRAQDVLGANNINNIQYVALMMMVAHHCGYKPGVFTHFIQNVHIYDRHIPIAKEILDRPISEKQPKLIFEPKSNNFYDFTIDDFKVVDYEPQKKIFIPIAI